MQEEEEVTRAGDAALYASDPTRILYSNKTLKFLRDHLVKSRVQQTCNRVSLAVPVLRSESNNRVLWPCGCSCVLRVSNVFFIARIMSNGNRKRANQENGKKWSPPPMGVPC